MRFNRWFVGPYVVRDVDGKALATYISKKLRAQLQVAAVMAPGFEDSRESILGDLVVVSGRTVSSRHIFSNMCIPTCVT